MVQYRKSKSVGPLRFTASNSGISASLGAGPVRVTRRADGRYQRTARLPGTGIRDTKIIGGATHQTQQPAQPNIAAQLAKLLGCLLLLGVFLSALTGSVATGFGIIGGVSVAGLVGIAIWLVGLRRSRDRQ